jgi:hypothetical protein
MSSCFVLTICITVADPFSSYTDQFAEMEFWDINLTKGWSLLLHDIQSPFHWQILKKIILFSGFKILTKKSTKQENLSLFRNRIFKTEK